VLPSVIGASGVSIGAEIITGKRQQERFKNVKQRFKVAQVVL